MEDKQFPGRFSVRSLDAKKLLERLRDFDIFPAPKIICVLADKLGYRVRGKGLIASKLKKSMLNKCDDIGQR